MSFNGMQMGLGNISKLSNAKSRSISAENVYGEKGKGGMAPFSDTSPKDVLKIGQKWKKEKASRDLGQKWKNRAYIELERESITTIMDVSGPGTIQHIWITVDNKMFRDLIMRIYWDNEEVPSVEAPIGDFFCNGFNTRTNILSLPINVNPNGGLNCFFPMPFRKHAKITIENRNPKDLEAFFYTINYIETEISNDEAYFHAQFRRSNPLPYGEDYTIVDTIKGKGHYVGTYMAWQQNNAGWWGEGEIKVFLDGDDEFPSICGTGTEDYFGGAWCFEGTYSAPFMGYPLGVDTMGKPGDRHGLYRFHIMDPIRFESNLKVTMQALGWRSENRFLPLQDDISSVAYWYQVEPHSPFPNLPGRDYMEVI